MNLTLQIQELCLEQLANKTNQTYTNNHRGRGGACSSRPTEIILLGRITVITIVVIETNMMRTQVTIGGSHEASIEVLHKMADLAPLEIEIEIPQVVEIRKTLHETHKHIWRNKKHVEMNN